MFLHWPSFIYHIRSHSASTKSLTFPSQMVGLLLALSLSHSSSGRMCGERARSCQLSILGSAFKLDRDPHPATHRVNMNRVSLLWDFDLLNSDLNFCL